MARWRWQLGAARVVAALVGCVGMCVAGCDGGSSDGEGSARRDRHKQNLLLITLDTVRADHLGCYGGEGSATPNLDRLARGGSRIERALAVAPLTLPSHATILSGTLPLTHGLRNNGGGAFPAELPTLATHFAAAGYRTAAFVGSFVLDHRFGLARGFEVYDDQMERGDERVSGFEAERRGAAVAERALAWLARDDPRPFFAWVHFYDAHAPYAPPEPFATQYRDRPYLGEIAAVDGQVGRLLALLGEKGWMETTVVAAVGDHGEALGEHGELTHGLFLYQPTLAVPFIVSAPGAIPAGTRLEGPVSLADAAATLADLAGRPMAPPANDLPAGRSLAPALRSGTEPPLREVYSETQYPATFGWSPLFALAKGSLKFIAAPRPEVYDLGLDPREAANRALELARPAAGFAARLAELQRATVERPAAAIDEATRARLSALGYVAPAASSPISSAAPLRDPKDAAASFRAFEEAQWAVRAGHFAAAITALEPLVAAEPSNAVFRSALAFALRQAGDFARALPLQRQAVALAPKDPDAWFNLGVALADAGQEEEAIAALEGALERDPLRSDALNALGVALTRLGRRAAALDAFERALKIDPGDSRAWNNLGNAYRDAERSEDAERAYQRALSLAPRSPDPLNGLGTLAVARDRPAEALRYFDEALGLNPRLHEVRLNRAIALELSGDRSAAAAAYRDYLTQTAGEKGLDEQRRAAERLLAQLERHH